MNNSKSKKDTKILLEEGARYFIGDCLYEIVETTSMNNYALRVDEKGESYGRVIKLGSLKNKKIEKQ